MNSISPQILHQKLSDEPDQGTIVDVRTSAEYEDAHIPGSKLLPLQSLKAEQVAPLAEQGTVYVLCRSGMRANQAMKKLSEANVPNLVHVEGGIMEWMNAGLPVERGERRVMPLDRQVLLAAGLINLVGIALGFLVHPGWFGLSAFVGCGLVLAGGANVCLMAMLLARMPWNQSSGNTNCATCSPASANSQEGNAS